MEAQEAWRRVPPRVAQGASGHRRADAEDPSYRGDEQCDWRRANAARAAGADRAGREAIAGVTADGAYDTRACGNAIAQRGGGDCAAQERAPVASLQSGIRAPKRGRAGMPAPGAWYLEDVERLSLAQPSGDQNALPQAPGRACHGAHLRAPGGGAACARGCAQPASVRSAGRRPCRWVPWHESVRGWGQGVRWHLCAAEPLRPAALDKNGRNFMRQLSSTPRRVACDFNSVLIRYAAWVMLLIAGLIKSPF